MGQSLDAWFCCKGQRRPCDHSLNTLASATDITLVQTALKTGNEESALQALVFLVLVNGCIGCECVACWGAGCTQVLSSKIAVMVDLATLSPPPSVAAKQSVFVFMKQCSAHVHQNQCIVLIQAALKARHPDSLPVLIAAAKPSPQESAIVTELQQKLQSLQVCCCSLNPHVRNLWPIVQVLQAIPARF